MRRWKTKILESWKDLLRKRERRLSILSGSQNRYIANTHLEAKIWRRIHGTHQWLRNTRFQAGTEGFIVVAHDQSLFTSNFQSNILHDGAVSRCRSCNTSTETIDHLISQCAILAQNEYTDIIVLDNIYTGKSVTIMILKHVTNGMNINRYLLWILQKPPFSETSPLELTEQYKLTGQI